MILNPFKRHRLKKAKLLVYNSTIAFLNSEIALVQKKELDITIIPIALRLTQSQIDLLEQMLVLDVPEDKIKEIDLHEVVSATISKTIDISLQQWIFPLETMKDVAIAAEIIRRRLYKEKGSTVEKI